ncbi:TetR/AcrR family transcriptional regulator [Pseudonocardia sp. TRM90224]|uniref:TetR/AcrR family transcriptional regulator n=1 Tax=Pseudonocardia sp. TRM90224 TaxID=2812678 RepID=UPI001E2BC4DE|nr:TetR/AcrR family transcriptional regulator [Pseudonocardia sp. TRM90224]
MEYAGRGDPARTMALLWRTAPGPRRGPKQGRTLDEIVAAALTLAARVGLMTLSMRAVAQHLGVGAASLYTYVPGKAELLELMVDAVVGARPLPVRGDDPRAALDAYARAELAGYREHPWLLQVASARSVFGPGVVARYDATLGLPDLPAAQAVQAIAALDAYVRGAAAEVVEAEQAPERTGRSDDEWWAAHLPMLDELMTAERFPRLAAVEAAGGFAVAATGRPYTLQRALDRFDAGLALLLDGISRNG